VRKPRHDDRWDRTPTGLIVPRRPTLPTRRYINPLGSTSCECCGEDTCEIWTTSKPASVVFTIADLVDDRCSACDGANGDNEVDFLASVANSPWGYNDCRDAYREYWSGTVQPRFVVHFFRESETLWTIYCVAHPYPASCTCPNNYGGTDTFTAFFTGEYSQSSKFETGQDYIVTITGMTLECQFGDRDACDISGATVTISP